MQTAQQNPGAAVPAADNTIARGTIDAEADGEDAKRKALKEKLKARIAFLRQTPVRTNFVWAGHGGDAVDDPINRATDALCAVYERVITNSQLDMALTLWNTDVVGIGAAPRLFVELGLQGDDAPLLRSLVICEEVAELAYYLSRLLTTRIKGRAPLSKLVERAFSDKYLPYPSTDDPRPHPVCGKSRAKAENSVMLRIESDIAGLGVPNARLTTVVDVGMGGGFKRELRRRLDLLHQWLLGLSVYTCVQSVDIRRPQFPRYHGLAPLLSPQDHVRYRDAWRIPGGPANPAFCGMSWCQHTLADRHDACGCYRGHVTYLLNHSLYYMTEADLSVINPEDRCYAIVHHFPGAAGSIPEDNPEFHWTCVNGAVRMEPAAHGGTTYAHPNVTQQLSDGTFLVTHRGVSRSYHASGVSSVDNVVHIYEIVNTGRQYHCRSWDSYASLGLKHAIAGFKDKLLGDSWFMKGLLMLAGKFGYHLARRNGFWPTYTEFALLAMTAGVARLAYRHITRPDTLGARFFHRVVTGPPTKSDDEEAVERQAHATMLRALKQGSSDQRETMANTMAALMRKYPDVSAEKIASAVHRAVGRASNERVAINRTLLDQVFTRSIENAKEACIDAASPLVFILSALRRK
jgi:hypothetical protein